MSTIDLITVDAPSREPLRCDPDEVQALFDDLAPCEESVLRGRWVGREVYTGHPLDGALANVAWYGKQFDGPDRGEVVDHFRLVGEDIALGSMEYPGMPRPCFFVLQRDNRGDNNVR